MCGRYALTYEEVVELEEFLNAVDSEKFGINDTGFQNYNVAPTNLMPIAYVDDSGKRILERMHWGYMGWVPDASQRPFLPINARDNNILKKPMWKKAFTERRCLVAMNGFYEWSGKKGSKKPHYISSTQRTFLVAAGVYSHLSPQEGINSYAIITTSANSLMEDIHDRMPAFLEPEEFDLWLNPETPIDILTDLLQPYPDYALKEFVVSKDVGNTRNNHPGLIEPANVKSEREKPSKDDQTSLF